MARGWKVDPQRSRPASGSETPAVGAKAAGLFGRIAGPAFWCWLQGQLGRCSAIAFEGEGDPDLAHSQLRAFSKQLPVLYGILIVNTVALAATHIDSAPAILTIFVPPSSCPNASWSCARPRRRSSPTTTAAWPTRTA